MVTIAKWLTQTYPYSKVPYFWADNLRLYHANCITQCTCSHTFAFIEAHPYILATCAGNSLVADEFPAQRPVTRSFIVFFDLRLNKRFSLTIITKKMTCIKNHHGVNCGTDICEESRSSWGRTGFRLYGLDKMATIMQTIFSNAFSWMKMCVSWP